MTNAKYYLLVGLAGMAWSIAAGVATYDRGKDIIKIGSATTFVENCWYTCEGGLTVPHGDCLSGMTMDTCDDGCRTTLQNGTTFVDCPAYVGTLPRTCDEVLHAQGWEDGLKCD